MESKTTAFRSHAHWNEAIAKRSLPGAARAVQFLAAESDLRHQKYMSCIILFSDCG